MFYLLHSPLIVEGLKQGPTFCRHPLNWTQTHLQTDKVNWNIPLPYTWPP